MLELRVGVLLVLAAYLFSLDAQILSAFDINLPHAFGYHNYTKNPRRVAHLMLLILVSGSLLFAIQRLVFPGITTRLIPLSTLVALFATILSQQRLFNVLKRVIIGRLSAENRLGDILVSDTLVSMAGVMVDFVCAVSLTYYNVPASDSVNRPSHIGYKILLTACIPQGIRIKQCVIDYKRSTDKIHLLNLAKYFVGNLPHALRANIASLNADVPEESGIRDYLQGLLPTVLFVNAIYSLMWDLIVDWKILRLRENRPKLLKFPRWWYYTAAISDAIMRFSFLAATPAEHIIFSLQLIELTRRAIWVVFRIESEPNELSDAIDISTIQQAL